VSLTDALDIVSHPRRWTLSNLLRACAPSSRKSLLERLSAEQRGRLFAVRGPEASGDQSLPKVPR
jgi:hypothetical protein